MKSTQVLSLTGYTQMALFAGVEMTFAQIVIPGMGTSAAWKVLIYVVYIGILVNLAGAAGSLSMVTTMSDMNWRVHALMAQNDNSLPAQLAKGNKIPENYFLEASSSLLMRDFGMPRRILIMGFAMGICFLLGCASIFLSIVMWVWLTMGAGFAAPLLIMPVITAWFTYNVVL